MSLRLVFTDRGSCVLSAQKNCLIEYPQRMFWLRNKKNNFQSPLLSGGLICLSERKYDSFGKVSFYKIAKTNLIG